MLYWLDILGTAVFAISGVLLAGKLRMDPFGVLVLGVVTAVGGGTIRDMALANGPVFWVRDPTDLVVAIITCFVTLLVIGQPRHLPKWILPVLDAIGLAVFVGIGVNKAFASGAVPLIAVCMGVITGVGGACCGMCWCGKFRLSCAPRFTPPPVSPAVLCIPWPTVSGISPFSTPPCWGWRRRCSSGWRPSAGT